MEPRFPFIGEYELTIDEKNRLLVPAEIRREIVPERDGEAFILKVGSNSKLTLYLEKPYQGFLDQVPSDVAPDPRLQRFELMHFATALRVPMDKQGRILLPDRLLKRTRTGRDVTLLGVNNRLEIWNREDWEAESRSMLMQAAVIDQQFREYLSTTRSAPLARNDQTH